jgi:hypothetical protein
MHFTGTQGDGSNIGIYVAEDYHKITTKNIRMPPIAGLSVTQKSINCFSSIQMR